MSYTQTDRKPCKDSSQSQEALSIGWLFRMLFKIVFSLFGLALHWLVVMLAFVGVIAIVFTVGFAIHVFPRLDFSQLDIQYSDPMALTPARTFDLSSVQEAQAKWALRGVQWGLVLLTNSESDIPLAMGANKYLELAIPGLKYANVYNERVYFSNLGFYVRKGEYFLPDDYFPYSQRYSTKLAPAMARASQQNVRLVEAQADYEPNAIARAICLSQAADPTVRCDSRCRKLIASKPDAGFAEIITHSIECWGAADL